MKFSEQFKILCLIILMSCGSSATSDKDTKLIQAVLDRQVVAWNNGNIDEFMEGYWKSDSLQFIGSSIATGWNATLERYKKSYPNQDAMGILRFEIWDMKHIDADAYLITGKYFLTRKSDSPNGIFTLLFRRIKGEWVIAYDHTG